MTLRDLDILRQVAEHRFIRSNWIIQLVGGSQQHLLRRLNLLYHHGYLERPRCQIDYYHQGGSKSLVYGLASRGAGRLRRDLDMPFNRMDWTTRNKRIGRLFLEHTLMISDFMVRLELDSRGRSDRRLIHADELPAPEGRDNAHELFRWSIDLSGRQRVTVVPDKVFAIDTTHPNGRVTRKLYLLEADRGSMPVKRSRLDHSSIHKKLLTYSALNDNSRFRDSLNGVSIKVMFLARTPERKSSVAQAVDNLTRHRSLFIVATDPRNERSTLSLL